MKLRQILIFCVDIIFMHDLYAFNGVLREEEEKTPFLVSRRS